MQKVAVTGGAGFIGSHTTETLVKLGKHVCVIDDLSTGFSKNLDNLPNDQITLIDASILDKDALKQAFEGVETVFHLAAKLDVAESMEAPVEYNETNTVGTLRVIRCAHDCGVQNVVIASSAAIYGDSPVVPKLETMQPEPKSPYAATKLAGEQYAQIYAKPGQLNIAIMRFFNVFGPRQSLASSYAGVIPIFMDKASKNESIVIFGDGEQTRDFIFVKDLVDACISAVGQNDIFNCAYSDPITVNELAKTIIKLSNSGSVIEYLPERNGDVKYSYANNEKIRRVLGFEPKWDLYKGLEETLKTFSGSP